MSIGKKPSAAVRSTVSPVLQSRLPEPEDIFLAWLLQVPEGVDLAAAAQREVERIDQSRVRGMAVARLRDLFVAAARSAARRHVH